jgi:inositol transport system substrate-binding protein
MKKLALTTAILAATSIPAQAETIGISIQNFDNMFQVLLRDGMEARAKELGLDVTVLDAKANVETQLSQIQNFIANGVDGIVLTVADSSIGSAISKAAADAGIPVAYVNIAPENVDQLPKNQAYVGSNEIESGTLGAFEACKLLRAAGKSNAANGYILQGSLVHEAAIQRTKDVRDILDDDMCKFINIDATVVGDWSRVKAQDITTNWLSTGSVPDVIFANNDEMALGAIQAMKAVGTNMNDVVVVGVDATADALTAMKAGDLDVTVFQNANGQGGGGIDTVMKLIKGEKVISPVFIPFELVTPNNVDSYISKN